MKKAISCARWSVINFIHYAFGKNKNIQKNANDKIVYLDLSQNHWHRYLAILLLFFKENGYTVFFRYRLLSWGSWSTSLFFIVKAPFRLIFKRPARYDIFISDSPSKENSLLLSADYFSPPQENSYHIPMCMVDTIYSNHLHEPKYDKNKERKRRIRIFFAGRINTHAYSNPLLSETFSIHSREELLQVIRKNFAQLAFTPSKEEEIFNDNEIEFALINRDVYNVPASKLRDLLADCDFFLALPGVVMPHCHNIIEAMSAGTIPVLQYAKWLNPPLENMKNCLTFDGIDDFQEVIRKASTMDQETIKLLRSEVFDYYNTHLRTDQVIRNIENLWTNGTNGKLFLNAEYHSVVLKNKSRPKLI